jgi:hypothetical protein
MRWSEEVELLQEEMRRVLMFCTWRESWWLERSRQSSASWPTPMLQGHQEGLTTYGLYQASIQRRLRDGFERRWHDIPKLLETHAEDSAHIDNYVGSGPSPPGAS